VSRGRAAILSALAVPAAVELYGIRHPGSEFTVSELIRWGFRVESRSGRVVFLVALSAGVTWLVPHVLRGASAVGKDVLSR
jgi:hypothetical protein